MTQDTRLRERQTVRRVFLLAIRMELLFANQGPAASTQSQAARRKDIPEILSGPAAVVLSACCEEQAMAVLVVLFGSLLVFRMLGWLGVELFDTWRDSARPALAVMLVFTGVAHFTKMSEDFARMVPRFFPWPKGMVYFTGVCELLGAVGILLPATRQLAGICVVLLLIAMFPANIRASREGILIRGKPQTPMWLRAPMQALFIALAWWATQPG